MIPHAGRVLTTESGPQRILAVQFADQFTDLYRDGRPPRLPMPDLPCPEQAKALVVPRDDGVRFDDDQSVPPVAPYRAQPCPKESIGWPQFRPLHRPIEDAQLMAQREVLQLQGGSRFEDDGRGGAHTSSAFRPRRLASPGTARFDFSSRVTMDVLPRCGSKRSSCRRLRWPSSS